MDDNEAAILDDDLELGIQDGDNFIPLHEVFAGPNGSTKLGDGTDYDGKISLNSVEEAAEFNGTTRRIKEAHGTNKAEGPRQKVKWTRIFLLGKPEWPIMGVATIALILSSLSNLVIPYYVRIVIDSVLQNGDDPMRMKNLEHAVIVLIAVFVLGSICVAFRSTLFTIAGERVVARIRNMLFAAIVKQEIGFFDITRTGELTNRLGTDTTVLQNTITVNVSEGLRYTATVIGGIIVLFFLSWKLTLVMLLCVPIVAFGAVAYGLFVRKLSKDRQEALADASTVAEETISNIRTVRSFSNEAFEIAKYSAKVEYSYALGKKMAVALGGFVGGVSFAGQLALGIVLAYGASLVMKEEISAGLLTQFLMYTLGVAFSLGGMSALYGDFMKAAGASERVFELLDRVPQVRYCGGISEKQMKGEITFKDVHFTYPSRPDQEVLRGISFDLTPGKVVALVGSSGGGKTTIANLIELFYYPTKGQILLDGKDLTSYDPEWLHSKVGLVSQGPVLFAASIAENIAYGARNVSREKIIEAAKIANAHEFIERFPEGYETMVGERGVRLSGGQKQRVAIARAILQACNVILLDEYSSDLDSASESLIKEALDRIMVNRTTLVIAHRLSTVKNADEILVIKDGLIAERGKHKDLMMLNGIYASLVASQLSL